MSAILVIDDSDAICTSLDILLSYSGYQVVCAKTPAAGLHVLASQPVSLVIPDMNFRRGAIESEEGSELFQTIRAAYGAIPVIVLSASYDQQVMGDLLA
jgi:CheY-like chemotaxis protein